MKLIVIIMTTLLVHASAGTFAQRVTLNKKNAALDKVLKEIRLQTGYNILYDVNLIQKANPVSLNVQNVSVEEAIEAVLKDQHMTYKVEEMNIIIKPKESTFLERLADRWASIDVHGVVVDNRETPMVGATVKVKGTNKVTYTNEKGSFYLQNVDEKAVLLISYLGYEAKEIAAVKELGIIRLLFIDKELDEVTINAGYYTVKERERTGSISRIEAKTIEKQPVSNPLMALQNRVSGLEITQLTGLPGSGFTVQIRGRNSINSGNNPLYLIDGVLFPSTKITSVPSTILSPSSDQGASPLSMINPGDIESIEVLKDADATAIYGSRGANGVILITTKKGLAGETKINISGFQGFSSVPRKVDLLNREEYLQMRREALKNDGLLIGTTDYDLNGTWDLNKSTNWQKELIGGSAKTTNVSLNLNGGTRKNNYLIAGNYYTEGTVFPGSLGFRRISLRSNINLGSSEDRFNANFTANFGSSESNLLSSDLTRFILLAPNAPYPYDQYGQLNWSNDTFNDNPMAFLLKTNSANTDNIVGNLTLSYKILKNLILKASLGYTTIKRNELEKIPLSSYPPSYGLPSNFNTSYFGNNYNNNWIAEPILSYSINLGKGKIDALLGTSFQNNDAQISSIKASGFSSSDLMENIGSAGFLENYYTKNSRYRYSAVYARANYNLLDKYFFNITGRRDGSSKFGPGKQFANFGAIGAAWVFSDEGNIKEIFSFLSFGKLRASYGLTGNDQISDYGYLQLWNTNSTYNGKATISPGGDAPNVDFAWETNRKLEVAIQLGFLKERINIEVSFYRNRSSNQLLYKSLPLSTGLGGLYANLPGKVQNTGWEFDTNFKVLNTDNFQWFAGLNLTIPKNKLLSYPELETSSDAINYQVGYPLSILKTYHVSVDKQTGLYVFKDKNGDGIIDNSDRYQTKFLGKYYYGGFHNSIKYHQFNLDFLISFTKQSGKSYINSVNGTPGSAFYSGITNQYSEVLNRWQQPSDETLIQKFSTTSESRDLYLTASYFGDLSIVDASYIRLKNVSLSYSFPKKWASTLKISNAAISIQGQNIFTITHYVGLDPEVQSLSIPPLRTIMIGLNLTF